MTHKATRKPNRHEWHRHHGMWTKSFGHRGARVRLFQKRRGGNFYRDVWLPNGHRSKHSLRTSDRATAERFVKIFLAALLGAEVPEHTGIITLRVLWDRYHTECATFLDNDEATKKVAAVRVKYLMAVLGEECDVQSLEPRDQAAYVATRRRGGILYTATDFYTGELVTRTTRPVRARSAESDLKLLHSMLNWATTVRVQKGVRWLSTNPLAGVKLEREKSPSRPMATYERYERTRSALQRLQDEAAKTEQPAMARHWCKIELALVIVEATGRRIGAVSQLRWDDIDFTRHSIRWRAEADKKRQEWNIPIPDSLLAELRQFQRRLGVVGGYVFAREDNPREPMDRHQFRMGLRRGEIKAGLPKLKGGQWHPYRRKWATERKHLSLTDVAAAGGWKDVETLLTCYQMPDANTLLSVMSEPRKVRDVATLGAG